MFIMIGMNLYRIQDGYMTFKDGDDEGLLSVFQKSLYYGTFMSNTNCITSVIPCKVYMV